MVEARRGTDPEEPRREREEVHPDYARGQEPEVVRADRPDFARGLRRDEMDQHEGDFAEASEDSEHGLEAMGHGDFAHGQRRDETDQHEGDFAEGS
jgi:hypothetical protein